jgi:predicted AlkP superfamily pyrophosphatase or phosphodiesterase
MIRKSLLPFCVGLISLSSQAQTKTKTKVDLAGLSRPKLVVGLMVDQMRWDFLYRYYDRYSNNGFKRLMREGFNCENTQIPYAQTVTAAGHTCVYTGSVPAIHGIMGNDWYDKSLGHEVYCTDDAAVKTIGGSEKAMPMSPKNLWTSTICDELKLATNFKAKTIGIAIKDRGGILPVGHMADAAYWYDGTSGNWVTSTYYMQQLPKWTVDFNAKKITDQFYKNDWNTLYPINTYQQSDADNAGYEGKYSFETAPVFPHILQSRIGKDYSTISATPYGNSMTLEFAKTAMKAESMGKDAVTDFLAVSLSSTDYVGHQFGPNSIEIEDTYLRLDKDISDFLIYLDKEVGKGQYAVFLTADHGVAHTPGFLKAHNYPVTTLPRANDIISKKAEEKFGIKNLIKDYSNYQLYLNDAAIDSAGKNKKEIKTFITDLMNRDSAVLIAFNTDEISEANLPKSIKEMYINGYNTKRGGDIQVVLKPGYFYGGKTGTTHGSWYPYDSHIPLLWMGWGIKPGKSNAAYSMTDIAPTIAALLHIQMPNGAIGKVIEEVIR